MIEVSGRLYPIEMRYRPVESEAIDPRPAAARAAEGGRGRGTRPRPLWTRWSTRSTRPGAAARRRAGFLPGEREIREAAEALRKAHHLPAPRSCRCSPRQSAQSRRAFSAVNGRRVVLSTNVAETSLTVPGIRYVVDTGLARIKRYSPRNKVERAADREDRPVRPPARRALRSVMDGICIRLYDEDDFKPPRAHRSEILRSSLAGVILRMKASSSARWGLPVHRRAAPRMIGDGYQLLAELGAVEEATMNALMNLTPIGANWPSCRSIRRSAA